MRRSAGFTLVELMIGMVVGLIVTGAALALFVATSKTYRSTTQVATLLDNARLGVAYLERDIQLAGYWGYLSSPSLIRGSAGSVTPLAVSVANIGDCDAELATRLQSPIEVIDNNTLGTCLHSYLPGTDVLVVRRAETGDSVLPAAYVDDRLYVKADHRFGRLFKGDSPPSDSFATPVETRPVQVIVYYVSTETEVTGAGSALHRIYLDAGPGLVDEELVAGVEDLQIEIGIDTDDDGSVNAYVAAPSTPAVLATAKALRINLLMHSSERDNLYTDTGDYLSLGSATPHVTLEARRRMQYAKTVLMKN